MVKEKLNGATDCACDLAHFIQQLYDGRDIVVITTASFVTGMIVGYGLGIYF